MAPGRIVFIAGGGKYGSIALEHFLKEPQWSVVVSDEDRDCRASTILRTRVDLNSFGNPSQTKYPLMIQGDAIEALLRFLSDDIVPETIVPCVPVHFAAKVLTRYLNNKGLKVRPNSLPLTRAFEKTRLRDVERAFSERDALALASKMPFDLRCVSDCSQPNSCPVTGRILDKPMYELMTEALNNAGVDIVKVLRSHLVAPSIGGFSGLELKQTIDRCAGESPCTLALATSCSCHAVANLFEIGT